MQKASTNKDQKNPSRKVLSAQPKALGTTDSTASFWNTWSIWKACNTYGYMAFDLSLSVDDRPCMKLQSTSVNNL